MQTLRWLRVPGDTVFAAGAVALAVFVAGLKTGQSFKNHKAPDGVDDSAASTSPDHKQEREASAASEHCA
jgi:nitric oxide reductase subunit B